MWFKADEASGGGARALPKKDIPDEVEEDRYFVVLTAYGFWITIKKKSKVLSEAHVSIREHSNEFDMRLRAMGTEAALFFGADSSGLQHLVLPEGKVEAGPAKSVGVVDGKQRWKSAQSDDWVANRFSFKAPILGLAQGLCSSLGSHYADQCLKPAVVTMACWHCPYSAGDERYV